MRCAWRLNHRYEAVSEIARSGDSSSVFLAHDLGSGNRLTALKVLRLERDDTWTAARREFEVLRRIHHPNIAEVYSLGKVDHVDMPHGGVVARGVVARGVVADAVVHGAVVAGADDAAPGTQLRRAPQPGDAFISFEYIDGLDLREAFLRLFPTRADLDSSDRWRVFFHALAGIFQGLECIHAHNLVHHDLKPENLLLVPRDERSNGSTAPAGFDSRIIDFGFAQRETTPLGREIKGTVPYIAPETVSGSFADGRSDLYSVGIALVQAVGGAFPFPVDSLESWIEALRSGDDLPIPPLLAGTPPEFVDLVVDLTRLDPARRPQTASAAYERVAAMAGGASRTPPRARGRIPAIGWERELELLRSELESLRFGETSHSLVLVEVDEGNYVHRLVEEIEVLASLSECVFCPGRARQPARFPYHPITEALRHVIRRVDIDSPPFRRFRSALSLLVPSVEAENGGPERRHLSARESRLDFVETIAEFLIQAARSSPVVLVLEELALADRDTLDLVRDLTHLLWRRQQADAGHEPARSGETEDGGGGGHRVLVIGLHSETASGPAHVGAEDDPDVATSVAGPHAIELLRSNPQCLELRIRSPGPDELEEWLKRRYPGARFARTTVRRIHEASDGAPRLVDEIIRATGLQNLAELGANGADGTATAPSDGGRVQPASPTSPDDQLAFLPASSEEIISARLRDLDAEALGLLEVLACARSPLRPATLLDVAGVATPDGEGAGHEPPPAPVAALVERSFVELLAGFDGPEVAWTDEATRARVAHTIRDERRLEIHARLLEVVLAGRDGEGSEEAAFHALHGGRFRTYVENSLRAAERLVDAHSRNTACRMLEEILRQTSLFGEVGAPGEDGLTPGEIEALRWTVLDRLGRAYRDSKDYTRALEKFTVLLSIEEARPDLQRRSELYRVMGEIYHENGDGVNALYFLEKSLRVLENHSPGLERIEALLSIARFHYKRGQLDRAETHAQQALDLVDRNDGEVYSRTCLQLAAICFKGNDLARSLSFNLRALEAARAAGDMVRTLEVFESLGTTYMSRGEYDKALEYFTRGIELATLLGSKRILAKILNHIGTIHFNRANHQLALENLERSLRLFSDIGDQRGVANSYNNIGLALCLKDDLAGAAESYRRAIEIFTLIGDEYGQAAGMNNLALILQLEGKHHDALEYAFRSLEKRKRYNSKSGIAFSYYRIGKIYQAKGELDKARGYAEKALVLRREIGEKMGIAHSRIQIAELLLLRGKLKEALERCEEGENEFEILENHYGRLVARETKARILMQVGDLDAAIKLFEDVLTQARQGNQPLLAGRSLLNLAGAFLEKGDIEEASRRLERAETTFRKYTNLRERVELHLAECRVLLELDEHQRAAKSLERVYETIEDLGIRDLVPLYFLLRGRLEIEGPSNDLTRGRKFLERALLESRETSLPDVRWQVHFYMGLLESRTGNPIGAAEQFASAFDTLESQAVGFPEERKAPFFRTHRTRARLLEKLVESRTEPERTGEPAERESEADGAPRMPALEERLRSLETTNRRLLKLQEITKAINSELELEALLEKVMDAVLDLMDGERGFLILRVPGDSGDEQISVARNLDRESLSHPESEISTSITAEVLESGKPVLTTNAVVDDRFSGAKSVRDLRLLSVLCVPLRTSDRVLGALYVDNRHRRSAFGENDLRVLETFSDQATTAIMNARLSEEIQQRNRELTRANVQMEELNRRLLGEVKRRTSELEATREHMQERLSRYESHLRFDKIIGKSQRMQEIFQLLERVAPTALPVLILGESGTGKELIARAIHTNSPRRERRFLSENCAALSDSLLESELFGHTRGAFTGATADRKGLFELASGGTLFLDEVAEMSLDMQKKLLRVLQEGELRRVGGKDTIRVDVRLISASNRDLARLVEDGSFREDLYYRLNGVRVDVPSLRERTEDLPLLVQHFLDQAAEEADLPRKQFDEDALRALLLHSWPGNVRELKHFIERTVLLTEGDVIRRAHCRLDGPAQPSADLARRSASEWEDLRELPLREARDVFVKRYVERCYRENGFNVTRAAGDCGMSRESFHRFLKKYDIQRPPGV